MADFGFARITVEDQAATHISTEVKGTAGYLDPEYITTYQLTDRSDVYSFGVLLVEVLTGRLPIELNKAPSERLTIKWVSFFCHFKIMWGGKMSGLVNGSKPVVFCTV